ncbi:MAG: trypsin-like peptidase domain-containing protein [Sumerlaeia bacterium]
MPHVRAQIRKNVLFAGVLFIGCLMGSFLAASRDGAVGSGISTAAQAQTGPAVAIAPVEPPRSKAAAVYRDVAESVVSIGAIKSAIVYDYDPYRDFFRNFMSRPQRIQQRTPYMGSGFLIDKEGHVLTNFHVIEDSDEVFVTLIDGREVPAKVLDADRFIDVALLKVDVPSVDLPQPLPLGDSDDLQIGETAMALGNPFGNLIDDPRPTITRGVVSALNRTFRPDVENMRVYRDMIQTDAAINPGNSGGPLVNDQGEAIGVNSFIFTRGGGSNGIGFAIPINRVRQFVDEVLEFGRIRPLSIDFKVVAVRSRDTQGVAVVDIVPGGAAEGVGLVEGDVIVAVDDQRVLSTRDFLLLLAAHQVGDRVLFDVWNQGEVRQIEYTITEYIARRG